MNVGVVVARFQAPVLTDGHISLLSRVVAKCDRMVVVLGTSSVVCPRDPLSYSLRERMVRQAYPGAIVWSIANERDDQDWVATLDHWLYTAFPRAVITLYGCRESCLEIYRKYGYNPVQHLDTNDLLKGVSATQMRAEIKEIDTEDFRRGVIHGVQTACPRVMAAVDVAIYRPRLGGPDKFSSSRYDVLLVRKHDENAFRFPGETVEANDQTFEHAARRAGYEECGLALDTLNYISSRNVPSWKFRGTGISIFSTFYAAPYLCGTPKINDTREIAEWKWVPLESVLLVSVVSEHIPFWKDLQDYLHPPVPKTEEALAC